ncbi:MAG: hypothetical protein V1815_00235 [Candidatus Woesearchaeota archaeon]
MAGNKPNINKINLSITKTIKKYKNTLGIDKNKGFKSSTYEIIKLINFDALEDQEYFEQLREDIASEYNDNLGHDEYFFYGVISKETNLNKIQVKRLFELQQKVGLPRCHIFLTNGIRNNEILPLLQECLNLKNENQKITLTSDMNLNKDLFEFIEVEFKDYGHTYIYRERTNKNKENYDYINSLKNDKKIRHITNITWMFYSDSLPVVFELSFNGFNSQTLIKHGGGSSNKKKNKHPYKISNVDTALMFEQELALIKPLGLHENKSCDCILHNDGLILNPDIIKFLEKSEYGKMWLEMHNLQKILDLLNEPESELLEITSISQRVKELGIIS